MPDQCRAVTDDGERCSREAVENGFCHQHGPENETVDDGDGDGAETDSDADAAEAETDGGTATAEADADATAEADAGEASSESDDGSDLQGTDIVAVRDAVREQVPDLVGRELDGVTGLVREEDGWVATVELVERHSVPDTQDILGQYEVTLTDDATIHGYRRLETYRRADGSPQEF